MKLRALDPMDIGRIEKAYDLLGDAASYLKDARANKSAAYVRRARKSVQGALRHVYRLRGR